ncbi:hypothetical protein EV175_001852 [Coemansia sp. RSA 1933]|nr:hypothetical protein EV175_001852 [Coemansia sp. RSA 1933]
MDSFIASLESQTIYLNALDDLSSTSTIPLYFWFENPVPSAILESSFYRALGDFPILAGRIKTGKDLHSFVVIDKAHLNLPEYTDTACNVHFQTLKDADYDVNLLPVDYSSACKTPVPHGIIGRSMKLAEFHVLRMKDNSGMCIFASVAHMILDGKGNYEFLRRWAEISSRFMREAAEQQDTSDIDIQTRNYQHNRSILETDRRGEWDALEPGISEMFGKSTAVARWIAWISPELRGKIFKLMITSTKATNHYYRLSSQAYENLVELIKPFIESDVSRLSANDIITALATVILAQAFYKTGRLDGETMFVTNVMIDARPRIQRLTEANYVGNAILVNSAANPLELYLRDCSPQVLATVACSIRRMVDGINERYCEQMSYMLNKSHSSYVDLLLHITKVGNSLASASHTRFGYYELDFGSGSPALVRLAFLVFENDFVIMPGRPDIGGYELTFTTVPEVARAMKESEYWKYIY